MYDIYSPNLKTNKPYHDNNPNNNNAKISKKNKLSLINNLEIKSICHDIESFITSKHNGYNTNTNTSTIMRKFVKSTKFSLSPERKNKLISMSTKHNDNKSRAYAIQGSKPNPKNSILNTSPFAREKAIISSILNKSDVLSSTDDNGLNKSIYLPNTKLPKNRVYHHRKHCTSIIGDSYHHPYQFINKSEPIENQFKENLFRDIEPTKIKNPPAIYGSCTSISPLHLPLSKSKLIEPKIIKDPAEEKISKPLSLSHTVEDKKVLSNGLAKPLKKTSEPSGIIPFKNESKAEEEEVQDKKCGNAGNASNAGGGNDIESHAQQVMVDETKSKDLPWMKNGTAVNPSYILCNMNEYLCEYERTEILKYDSIYYISDLSQKINALDETYYANDKGDYKVIKSDHIGYRYEIYSVLGKGSFGQVLKVFDHKKQQYLALKVIRNQKKFHYQAKIEIKILSYMNQKHAIDYNIVELKDHFIFRGHMILVFELMSHNLYDYMRQNKFKGCSLSLIRRFAIQILYALKFLRKHHIIHCDIKPENILLKQSTKSGIRLIDFGSSCYENEKLYSYIQSRFYRSPEIIFGLTYTTQIDMWSFGCLMCELFTGIPLFPGENEHDQILAIMEILGIPPKSILDKSPRKKLYFDGDNPIVVPNSKGKIRYPNKLTLGEAMKCPDAKFVDLIQKCLNYDPEKRISPDDALLHEWILDGLPPSLYAGHLKVIQDGGNPALAYQLNPRTLPTDILRVEEDSKIPLQEKRRDSQSRVISQLTSQTNITPQGNSDIFNDLPLAITLTNPAITDIDQTKPSPMINISTKGKMILDRYQSYHQQQQQQQCQPYISKEHIQNIEYKRKELLNTSLKVELAMMNAKTEEEEQRKEQEEARVGIRNAEFEVERIRRDEKECKGEIKEDNIIITRYKMYNKRVKSFEINEDEKKEMRKENLRKSYNANLVNNFFEYNAGNKKRPSLMTKSVNKEEFSNLMDATGISPSGNFSIDNNAFRQSLNEKSIAMSLKQKSSHQSRPPQNIG